MNQISVEAVLREICVKITRDVQSSRAVSGVLTHRKIKSSVSAFTIPEPKPLRWGKFSVCDIRSLLDFVIMDVDGEPYAIQCCEHCGEIKNWTAENVMYLHGISHLVKKVLKMKTAP